MDARFQPRMISSSVNPAKDVRTGYFLACHDVPEVMAQSSSFCRRLSEIMRGDLPSFLSFRSAGGRMRAVTGCLRAFASSIPVVRATVIAVFVYVCKFTPGLWGRVSLFYCWHFAMQVIGKNASGLVYMEKSVDKLNMRQFCERFCIPNNVSKFADNAIYFSKEQFNAGLRFPLLSLFKDILNMLFNLDLSLLEVLFIYTIKKGKTDIFSLFAHIPSLQLVTNLPDSNKGGAKGHVLVKGLWAELLEQPEREFTPNRSLALPGTSNRGHLVEWVEKASFNCLNKLFEITAVERHYQTLLTARNLLAVVRETQSYVINILPRRLPKFVVPEEHFVLKDLPFYERAREADAKARQESSSCESGPSWPDHTVPEPEDTSSSPQLETFHPGPSSPQHQTDFVGLRVVHEPKEVRDMNDLRARLLRRHLKRLYDPIDLGPPSAKKVCPERGGEDAASEVPLSSSTHPDEAGPSATAARSEVQCSIDIIAFGDAPIVVETRGSKGVLDASIDEKAPDEKSSLDAAVPPSWEELMEMLKGVSCFTDAEAPSTRMSDFFSLTKRVSLNIGGDPPAFVKAQLPFGTPESVVSCIQHLQEWTIPETVEVVVADIRYMMRTREQLFKRLEVVEAMRAFISQYLDNIEELRSRMEKVEAKLAAARKAMADGTEQLSQAEKEKGAIRAEAHTLKKEKEALEG
ncbi:hypothetical protein AAG906_020780 [Vitis piasezkii]